MIILFNRWNNTTEENEDNIIDNASEGMSTPPPKNNTGEGSKGEDDEFSFDTDNEGICFLVWLL